MDHKNIDLDKKNNLLTAVREECAKDEKVLKDYVGSLRVHRTKVSLMMNSYMHNVVDIENAAKSSVDFLK